MSDELIKYDEMCRLITECERVDEVKDIRDKTKGLEIYYRQAKNRDAERQLANIRLRAERRAGELLKELERAKAPNPQGLGGHTGKVVMSDAATQQVASPYARTLAENGISRQEANQFENLAKVPLKDFEKALASPGRPTAAKIIANSRPPTPRTGRHDPHKERPKETKAREIIRASLDAGQPVNVRELGKELGISHVLVEQAAAIERAVESEVEQVDDPTLKLTKRQELYLERLEKKLRRELELDRLNMDREISRRVVEHIDQMYLPAEKKRLAEMESALLNQFRPPFTNAQYRALVAALHPDSTNVERRTEMFHLVTEMGVKLRGIDPAGPKLPPLPDNLADLLARRKRPMRA